MRHLVWWLRSAFCNHEWEREEEPVDIVDALTGRKMTTTEYVSATCVHCGWHRSYRKY